MKCNYCSTLKSCGKENSTAVAGWIGACIAIGLSFWFLHLSEGKKLDHVGTWILSANFAAAFFAINFAFIGYNLSPYSKLWRRLSWSHWILILFLISLPTFPIVTFLIKPDWMWNVAIIISPWVTFLSGVTYYTTGNLIDPRRVLKIEYAPKAISSYCAKLAETIHADAERQKKTANLIPVGERPMHMWSYHPTVIEAKQEPLWDRLMIVFSVAIDAHDYEVFEIAFDRAFAIYKELLKTKAEENSRAGEGLQYLAERRLKSLIALVGKSSSDRIFMEAINNRLCVDLTSPECLQGFKNKLPHSIMGMLEEICREALVEKKDYDALKALNAMHTFSAVAAAEARKTRDDYLAPFSISAPISMIKRIGSYAVVGEDVEMLYRCLDAVAWLGCGIASNCGDPAHREEEPLKTCIASLVQLGREARYKKLQCFWDRCILPPHVHAEEKLGWILKLLVQIPARHKESGFYLQRTITEAYARLRGYECQIKPDPSLNPKFWIEDEKDKDDKKIPLIMSMSGHEGYNWEIDYSDKTELKEYTLH
jgi:hypothetical protein